MKSGAAKAVTDSKQLYRQGLEWGMEPVGISFDAALAGYLLNPTASGYDLERLSAAYGAKNWSLPQVPGYEIPLERLARLMAVYEPMEKNWPKTSRSICCSRWRSRWRGYCLRWKRRIRH